MGCRPDVVVSVGVGVDVDVDVDVEVEVDVDMDIDVNVGVNVGVGVGVDVVVIGGDFDCNVLRRKVLANRVADFDRSPYSFFFLELFEGCCPS